MRLRRVFMVFASIGVAGVLWDTAMTVLVANASPDPPPGALVIPAGLGLAAVSMVAGVFGAAILGVDPESSGGRIRMLPTFSTLLRRIPWWVSWPAVALVVVLLLNAWVANGGSDGMPEIDQGQYALSSHGVATYVDRATYERAIADDDREASAGLAAVGLIAVALNFCAAGAPPRKGGVSWSGPLWIDK